jgi:hypothetical protein
MKPSNFDLTVSLHEDSHTIMMNIKLVGAPFDAKISRPTMLDFCALTFDAFNAQVARCNVDNLDVG